MSQFVSHNAIVDNYYDNFSLNPVICDIAVPYKTTTNSSGTKSRKRKRKPNEPCGKIDVDATERDSQKSAIQLKFELFMKSNTSLSKPESDTRTDNKDALAFMDTIHALPYPSTLFNGANTNDYSIECELNGETFLIPPNCRFFNKNVLNAQLFLPLDNQFDFIVMDPPWWNKYIRRINSVKQENGYKMLDNEDIMSLPIDQLLSEEGLVVIWCTNSPSHRAAIETEMLVKWNLELITIWHWVKVTRNGDPICDFHPGTGKQPYELIFIAGRKGVDFDRLPKEQMLVSVPSVIHSHKFPIFDIIKPLIETVGQPLNCLEIFARYLQPNFTSVGLEVLKLQNKKLFIEKFNH